MRVKLHPFNSSDGALNFSMAQINNSLGLPGPVHEVLREDVALVRLIKIVSDSLLARDGYHVMVIGFIFWTLFWWVSFYVVAFSERWWGKCLPKSTKEHENDRFWLTRHLLGSVMALVVCCITVPAIFRFAGQPAYMKFASTPHLAYCESPEIGEPLQTWGVLVAFAGMVFTSYIIADSVLMFTHDFATPDYIAHHVAFIAAGILIRYNCMLPYNAAILMTMEASTPFLNFLLVYRHRHANTIALAFAGVMFFLLFSLTRLAMNTWGAVELMRHYEEHIKSVVPVWQARSILVMVMAGAIVQFFWAPAVIKAFGANLIPVVRGSLGMDDAAEVQRQLNEK